MYSYKDPNVAKLIWALKYDERWSVIEDVLRGVRRPSFEFDSIAYIPMSDRKSRDRGYNQSRLLALMLGKMWKVRVVEGLKKRDNSRSLAKSVSVKERKILVYGAYKYVGEKLEGRKVLLVDDVFTTGATMNEVAKQLLSAEVKEVWGWTLAS